MTPLRLAMSLALMHSQDTQWAVEQELSLRLEPMVRLGLGLVSENSAVLRLRQTLALKLADGLG